MLKETAQKMRSSSEALDRITQSYTEMFGK